MKRSAGIWTATAIMVCSLTFGSRADYRTSWDISSGSSNREFILSFSDSRHPVVPGLKMRITADNRGKALRGEVTFVNGVSRGLTDGELEYYWYHYQGEHALWDHLNRAGQVTVFRPATGPVPADFVGARVRMLTVNGIWFLGKITDRQQGELRLDVNRNIISFDVSVIERLERISGR